MSNTKIYFLLEDGLDDICNTVLSDRSARMIERSRAKENRFGSVPEYKVYTLDDDSRASGRNSLQFAFIMKPKLDDEDIFSEDIQKRVLALGEELKIRKPDYVISVSSYISEAPSILVPNSTFWNMFKEHTEFYFSGIRDMNLGNTLDNELWRNVSEYFRECQMKDMGKPTMLLPWSFKQNDKAYQEFFETYAKLGIILDETQYETQLMLRCQKLAGEYEPLTGKLRFGKIIAGYDRNSESHVIQELGEFIPGLIWRIERYKKNSEAVRKTKLTL